MLNDHYKKYVANLGWTDYQNESNVISISKPAVTMRDNEGRPAEYVTQYPGGPNIKELSHQLQLTSDTSPAVSLRVSLRGSGMVQLF